MKKFLTCCILALLLTAFATFAQSSVGYPSAKLQGRKVYEPSLRAPSVASRYEGVVAVKVWVDQYGNVKRAEPGANGTTIKTGLAWSASRAAAMEARFTTKHDAPVLQEGVISYAFTYSEALESAADENALKFVGIPVTGDKRAMIEALVQKGFKRDSYEKGDVQGMFNGEKVSIEIFTNHENVDRVHVMYPFCDEANDTRVKYNVLLSKFNRNDKYVCINPRTEIPANESIYFKLVDNSKYYDAVYFYLTSGTDAQQWAESFRQEYEKKYDKSMEGLSYEEIEEALFCLPETIANDVAGVVWFTIKDVHYITIDYVNLKNRPRGEDL